MLLESGWTDDLFGPGQSLRAYNQARAVKGYAALMLGDLGHARASNDENADHAFNEEGAGFFAAELEHAGTAPADGSVSSTTAQTFTSAGASPTIANEFDPIEEDETELLGRDAPYYRASNFPFTVEVAGLQLALPST